MSSFAGSADYYTFDSYSGIMVKNYNSTGDGHVLGAIFVDTKDGHRFWVNSSQGNFSIDLNMAYTLAAKGQTSGYWGGTRSKSVEELSKTADYNTYLNPQACR